MQIQYHPRRRAHLPRELSTPIENLAKLIRATCRQMVVTVLLPDQPSFYLYFMDGGADRLLYATEERWSTKAALQASLVSQEHEPPRSQLHVNGIVRRRLQELEQAVRRFVESVPDAQVAVVIVPRAYNRDPAETLYAAFNGHEERASNPGFGDEAEEWTEQWLPFKS